MTVHCETWSVISLATVTCACCGLSLQQSTLCESCDSLATATYFSCVIISATVRFVCVVRLA